MSNLPIIGAPASHWHVIVSSIQNKEAAFDHTCVSREYADNVARDAIKASIIEGDSRDHDMEIVQHGSDWVSCVSQDGSVGTDVVYKHCWSELCPMNRVRPGVRIGRDEWRWLDVDD